MKIDDNFFNLYNDIAKIVRNKYTRNKRRKHRAEQKIMIIKNKFKGANKNDKPKRTICS